MSNSVKVSVVKYADREHLILRWRDPLTGKVRCKTSGTTRRRDAERVAAKLEREILEGQHGPASRMSWSDFREHHERHCLSALKSKSGDCYAVALNVFERFHKPERLSDVTAARITAWQTQLRSEGKADASIANYSRHLRAVLSWAKSQGLLAVVPKFTMPKRVKGAKIMKGRAITTEEFERMLAAVPSVVGQNPKSANLRKTKSEASEILGVSKKSDERSANVPTVNADDATVKSWKFYLRGLWLSGLRLSESLKLRWDAEPGALVVDFTGRRPMLRIPAESEKGGQDRVLPIAPEFAELLQATPEGERRGRVFKLIGQRWGNAPMQSDWVSRVVCRIGSKARVVVDQREQRLAVDSRSSKATAKPQRPAKASRAKPPADAGDGLKRKYASAHDLRRAFGLRWSARVMPAVLQQLMRHESVDTTMKYYVGRDADAVADVLWGAVESASTIEQARSKQKSTR